MVVHVQKSKCPATSVNHHGLIKLLGLHSLARQGKRWDEIVIVLEEGSTAKVSAQQGDAMGEQEGMHVGEFSRPGSHEEQDDAAASNADAFVDQTVPEEFSQAADPVYHSPLNNPRGNGQGDEAINKQSTRQGAETFASHEVSPPKLPQVSPEVEILGEVLQRSILHEKGGPSGPFLHKRDLKLI
jgi:hypothetical protein